MYIREERNLIGIRCKPYLQALTNWAGVRRHGYAANLVAITMSFFPGEEGISDILFLENVQFQQATKRGRKIGMN